MLTTDTTLPFAVRKVVDRALIPFMASLRGFYRLAAPDGLLALSVAVAPLPLYAIVCAKRLKMSENGFASAPTYSL